MTDPVKGYLWAELDIADPARFESEYSVHVRPLVARFGGRFLVVDDHPDVREGGRRVGRVVLLEFDSPERATEFYDSADYQAIIATRERWSTGHLYLARGWPSPD